MHPESRFFFPTRTARALLPLIALALIALAPMAVRADVPISAAWAPAPPSIDGIVGAGEWAAATTTPLTHGSMHTMNDGAFLYVLLDVVDDTSAQPPGSGVSGDWFAIPFDVDLNYAVTPNVDLAYATCQDGRTFVKTYYLSPTTFTGCQEVTAPTAGAMGFGPTFNSATPHRFWEFQFSFDEIGVDPSLWSLSLGTPPRVRFNVTTRSEIPPFHSSEPDPTTYPSTLANLFALDLAMSPAYPPGTAGPTFAGVGLVPSSYIDSDGYADIHIAGYYSATDAPFGGKLSIFGHWSTLASTPGVKKYRVLYRQGAGPWTRLLQTWTNFKWNGTTWVPMVIGPDADDAYRIPPPSEIWYLDDLIMGWQTSGFPNGKYELKLELLNNGGNVVASPPDNSLSLFIVNAPPAVSIDGVQYAGSPIGACSIVTQGPAPDGFEFTISVTDTYGALAAYRLYGIYGNNLNTGTLHSDSYASNVNADGPHQWDGVSGITVPAPPFRATTSCAYSFILSASSRTQNGYGRLFPNVNSHLSLTILLPDDSPCQ
jgi:hypothetical protein